MENKTFEEVLKEFKEAMDAREAAWKALLATPERKEYEEAKNALWATPEYKNYDKAKMAMAEAWKAVEATPEWKALEEAWRQERS